MSILHGITLLPSRTRLLAAALTVTILATCAPEIHAAASIEAKLDSATLLMGKVTTLNVTLVKPSADRGKIIVPPDSLASGVEVVGETGGDTSSLGNGMEEIHRRIVIQSFDSGLYTLKPILYVSAIGDTLRSGSAVLKVLPVNVDSLTTIHDYAGVQDGEKHFWDFLPDFLTDWGIWMVVILAVVVAGIILYFKYFKKGRLPLMPKKKEEPPYDKAVRQLNELHAKHLCENGREKEFYTDLTEILRSYLDARFHINAMEMTSSQILRALETNEETRLSKVHMARILEVADYVKFAAQRPLPDDNVKAFRSAMQFVEDTKPTPAETQEGTSDSPSQSSGNSSATPVNTPDK